MLKYRYTAHVVTKQDPKRPYVYDVVANTVDEAKKRTRRGFKFNYPKLKIQSIKIGNRWIATPY